MGDIGITSTMTMKTNESRNKKNGMNKLCDRKQNSFCLNTYNNTLFQFIT